jgi:hypothetical protein
VNKVSLCKGVSVCEGFVLDREVALCLDLFLEGVSGAQCTDLLSSAKLNYVA